MDREHLAELAVELVTIEEKLDVVPVRHFDKARRTEYRSTLLRQRAEVFEKMRELVHSDRAKG